MIEVFLRLSPSLYSFPRKVALIPSGKWLTSSSLHLVYHSNHRIFFHWISLKFTWLESSWWLKLQSLGLEALWSPLCQTIFLPPSLSEGLDPGLPSLGKGPLTGRHRWKSRDTMEGKANSLDKCQPGVRFYKSQSHSYYPSSECCFPLSIALHGAIMSSWWESKKAGFLS